MARLGFVVSEFNRDITYQMELLGREHARFLGAEVTSVVYVPGVFDMPIAVKKLLRREDIDAVVTIGCVIQGETAHDEVVVSQAARKLMDLSLEFDKPVLGPRCPGPTPTSALTTPRGRSKRLSSFSRGWEEIKQWSQPGWPPFRSPAP